MAAIVLAVGSAQGYKAWKTKRAEAAAKAEVAAAQDDLRDLTFHLEAQAKIVAEGGGGGELSGGDLAGVTPKPERRKGKRKVHS